MMLIYISQLKEENTKYKTNDIPKLTRTSNQTGNQMDIQAVKDMEQICLSFR